MAILRQGERRVARKDAVRWSCDVLLRWCPHRGLSPVACRSVRNVTEPMVPPTVTGAVAQSRAVDSEDGSMVFDSFVPSAFLSPRDSSLDSWWLDILDDNGDVAETRGPFPSSRAAESWLWAIYGECPHRTREVRP